MRHAAVHVISVASCRELKDSTNVLAYKCFEQSTLPRPVPMSRLAALCSLLSSCKEEIVSDRPDLPVTFTWPGRQCWDARAEAG